MNDLAEIDRAIYKRELKRKWPNFLLAIILLVSAVAASEELPLAIMLYGFAFLTGYLAVKKAKESALQKRFCNPYFETRWKECKERVERFQSAVNGMPNSRVSSLVEVPKTVEKVALNLYETLRRADIVANELHKSEGIQFGDPSKYQTQIKTSQHVPDRQSNELWVAADKNRAEYTQRIQAVQMKVVRSDAQVEVFITAMDALRANLMNLKLSGSSNDQSSHAILTSMAEIKLQMCSINNALDELDFSIYPTTVTIDGTRSGLEPVLDPSGNPDVHVEAPEKSPTDFLHLFENELEKPISHPTTDEPPPKVDGQPDDASQGSKKAEPPPFRPNR